jgi:hypothetical protein
MTDTPAPTPAKAPDKPAKPAAATKTTITPSIKASPINPAWASEVAKAYGLSGPVADAVADHLAKTVGEQLDKVTKPAKLAKLVKEAFNKCIG